MGRWPGGLMGGDGDGGVEREEQYHIHKFIM